MSAEASTPVDECNQWRGGDGMLVFSRIPDAGGVQPHGEDLQLHQRRFHGAGLLQQLHVLQDSQKRLPDAAVNVSGPQR